MVPEDRLNFPRRHAAICDGRYVSVPLVGIVTKQVETWLDETYEAKPSHSSEYDYRECGNGQFYFVGVRCSSRGVVTLKKEEEEGDLFL